MDNILTQLQDILQQELVAYKNILDKGRQKKDALLKNDVDMLDRIVAYEWSIVKAIKQLEAERELIIQKIALEKGLDSQTVTLDDIAGLQDGALRTGFLALKKELKKIISEIDALSRVNKGLVDTHLQYSTYCVNLLTGHQNTLNTYSYAGRMSDSQERPTLVLDRTV